MRRKLGGWDGAAFRRIDDVPIAERAAKTNRPTKTIWVTGDGTRIRVRDMDDSHLVNTVRYLLRTAECRKPALLLDMYDVACTFTGEMAQEAIDCETNAVEDMDADDLLHYAGPPTWPALLEEIDRRNLGAWIWGDSARVSASALQRR